MTKLVALVDGSIYSQSVCEHVAWIAGRTGSDVEILHVIGRRETGSAPQDLSGSISLGARTALLEELSSLDEQRAKISQMRGRAILDDAKALLEQAGVSSVATKLRIGDLVDSVAESESDADLIVLGKRGEAADFATAHLGSNLERIVRSSAKPVFVASRAFVPIERFLIAYDGGVSSMKAVDYIARSPLFTGLECRLLMVGQETANNRRQIEGAEALLRGAGLSVTADVIPGQADSVISDIVEDEKIGLLVMGAYGHSRIRNLVIGSTTTEMVRSCRVPVMLFR